MKLTTTVPLVKYILKWFVVGYLGQMYVFVSLCAFPFVFMHSAALCVCLRIIKIGDPTDVQL